MYINDTLSNFLSDSEIITIRYWEIIFIFSLQNKCILSYFRYFHENSSFLTKKRRQIHTFEWAGIPVFKPVHKTPLTLFNWCINIGALTFFDQCINLFLPVHKPHFTFTNFNRCTNLVKPVVHYMIVSAYLIFKLGNCI